MLAHLALVLAFSFNSRAQSFTPVDYDFIDVAGQIGRPIDNTSENHYTEYTDNTQHEFSVSSAASNGYGTWIATNDGRWILLGNSLSNEKVVAGSPEQSIPSGILASGLTGAPNGQVKVATNGYGSARYVWLQKSQTAQTYVFNVTGFDDHGPLANLNNKGNLSGIPSSAGTLDVVNRSLGIHAVQQITFNLPALTGGASANTLFENDWRDFFDIAMDGSFLYIVFAVNYNFQGNDQYDVFTFAVDILTGQPILMQGNNPFAQRVNGNAASGRRPTVSCNKRDNSDRATAVPLFDVAYVGWGGQPVPNWDFVHIAKLTCDASTGSLHYHSIPEDFANPVKTVVLGNPQNQNAPHPWFLGVGDPPQNQPSYGNPMHARIIDGSVSLNAASAQPSKCVYVAVDGLYLYYYRIQTVAGANDIIAPGPPTPPIAFKVDGSSSTDETFNYASERVAPIPSTFGGNPISYHVMDEPITAFENLYDGQLNQPDRNDDEFHCVYRILGDDPGATPKLAIVHGCNNGRYPKLDDPATIAPDTRMVLNRTRPTPATPWANGVLLPGPITPSTTASGYTASCNQMGIHVFWDQGDSHFEGGTTEPHIWYYKRDLRQFDEPIEEHTLATNVCIVGNGTSHLGTNGAMIADGNWMTLWTDPNFNAGALYARNPLSPDGFNNAQLLITGSATLGIGDNSASSSSNAVLNLPPNFEVTFGPTSSTDNPSVAVNPWSRLEYYGIPSATSPPPTANPITNFHNRGSIILQGTSSARAVLNVHGGAECQISDYVTLNGSNSDIRVLFEPSILPLAPGTTNPSVAGFIDAYGTVILGGCLLTDGGNVLPNLNDNTKNWVWRALVLKPPLATLSSTVPSQQLQMDGTTTSTSLSNARLEVSFNTAVDRFAPSTGPENLKVLGSETHGGDHTAPTQLSNPRTIYVIRSTFNRATLYGANPQDGSDGSNVQVYFSTFTPGFGRGLYLFRDGTDGYHHIDIASNNFSHGDAPCRIEGFDEPVSYQQEFHEGNNTFYVPQNHLLVSGNNFDNSGAGDNGATGLLVVNSNIGADYNTIDGYGTGIQQTQPVAQTQLNTSFYCFERISDAVNSGAGNGFLADNWGGYLKLTRVWGSDVGLTLGDKINGGLVYSYIHDCTNQGILVLGGSSNGLALLDMSGTHDLSQSVDLASYDTIELNNSAGKNSATTGQIELGTNGRLRVGTFTDATSPSNFAKSNFKYWALQDNIICHNPTSSPVQLGFNPLASLDDNIDNNYFSDGNGNTKSNAQFVSNTAPFSGVTFQAPVSSSQASYYSTSGIDCGADQFTGPKSGTPRPQFTMFDTSRCVALYNQAGGYAADHDYQRAYDTARAYIEQCYDYTRSWEEFGVIGGYNDNRPSTLVRYQEYRSWLLKVLYLNPDSNYFCSDAGELLATFRWFNDQRGDDFRGTLTLANWIIDSSVCKGLGDYLKTKLKATWDELYSRWSDTVADRVNNPFDSTLPTLDDLGLGLLRGKPASVREFIDSKLGPMITVIGAMPNPFTDETRIDFTCREAVAVRFEVFDVLGARIYDGGEKVYSEGENTVTVPASRLPHGILYARFSASDGSVKTVKIRRQ